MLSSTLSGEKIRGLMRKHQVTIAALALRLGSTQKRVRQVREKGLQDHLAVRDWLQAITGQDPGPIPQRYWIRSHTEEAPCAYCGGPMYVGDFAFEYVGEVFCSVTCCRKSRNWE